MNKKQENKYSMYQATKKALDEYTSVWSGVAIMGNVLHPKFKDIIEQIRINNVKQELDTTGVAKSKQKLKEDVASKAVAVGSLLAAYASIEGNDELYAKVNYPVSDITGVRDNYAVSRAKIILEKGIEFMPDMDDYGLTQGHLDKLSIVINSFEQKIQTPRLEINFKSEATAALVELFKDADKLLKEQMDKVLKQFDGTEFYMVYTKARVIVDL